MTVLACLLSFLVCQTPAVVDDPFSRLGLDADLVATLAGWRVPSPRLPGLDRPALARRVTEAPRLAAQRAEVFVREALAEILPVPLLRAAADGFGCARMDKGKEFPARMTVRAFEEVLARAHREIEGALGSGRSSEMLAPALQAAVERVLLPGGCDALDARARGELKDLFARVGKVDLGSMQAQASLIVRAALALAEGEAGALARASTTPGERGVSGPVVFDGATPFGRFVIGGVGVNEYECEQVAVIVDLGGNDTYRGPVAGAGVVRRLAVVVDLAGDDTYRARNDGLGSATFGVGLLLDLAGNDDYEGDRRCAGFGAAGLGALFDLGGADKLVLAGDGGGAGFAGIGVYLDAGAGKDHARVGPRTLGCGLPGGLGLFVDDGGDDERDVLAGDALGAAACGVGFGVNGWLAGGVGLFVDVEGVDRYTGGDLLCGAAVDGGVGIFFDAAGHDTYIVGGLALGSAREYGSGLFVDAAGDDSYETTGPCLGSAVGNAHGHAEDRAGQDLYNLRGAWPAHAAAGALGVFLEFDGKDRYRVTDVAAAAKPSKPAANARAAALSVHEDRGADADLYDDTEGTARRGNDHDFRLSGDVVLVFSDR